MREIDAEAKYLIGTKLKQDRDRFRQLVKDAYLVEFGYTKDSQIAASWGRSPGRISQVLGDPRKIESVALSRLLEPLRNVVMKRRIIRSWVDARFGIDLLERPTAEEIEIRSSESLIKLVRKQLAQGQPLLAASTALAAVKKEPERALKEQLLDAAFMAYIMYSLPGQAMAVARRIVDSGRQHRDLRREARGYFDRARALLTVADCRPEEIRPLIDDVAALMTRVGPQPNPAPPYLLIHDDDLPWLEMEATVALTERGVLSKDESRLRELARFISSLPDQQAKRRRFLRHFQMARIHLLLGETFHAQEFLERAYNSSGGDSFLSKEQCGAIQGQVLALTESKEVGRDYLTLMSRNIIRRCDLYHLRGVEGALARIESSLYPNVQ